MGYTRANTTNSEDLNTPEPESEGGPRIKIKAGMNVFIMAPAFGRMKLPLRHVLLHYRPFHLCGRKDPQMRIDRQGERYLYTDSTFADCHRCNTAWNEYVNAGYKKELKGNLPPDVELFKQKIFKPNLSDNKTLVQVIDVGPFFNVKGVLKDKIEPNKELIKAWLNDFWNIMINGAPVPEGMPEDIALAAQCGIQTIVLNKTAGITLENAYVGELEQREGFCDEGVSPDPTHNPHECLLKVIKRERPDNSIEIVGPNGLSQKVKTYDYDIKFSDLREVGKNGWVTPQELDKAGVFDYVEGNAKDLLNMQVTPTADGSEPDVRQKASDMCRLTDDEIAQLLKVSEHSWSVVSDDQPPVLEDVEPEDGPPTTRTGAFSNLKNKVLQNGDYSAAFEDDDIPF